MAQQAVRHRPWAVCLSIAIPAALLVTLLHSSLMPVEEQTTTLQYRLRGDRRADTNIVCVYIDDEAIKSLGWPVRRNFYALMVKALTDLRAKAIGIEPVFEDRKTEFAEYDNLFATVVGASGNVILSSYFDVIANQASPRDSSLDTVAQFSFPHVNDLAFHGTGPHLPFRTLCAAAEGVGHLNFTETQDLPVFVSSGAGRVGSFACEVLRVYEGVDRKGVLFTNDEFFFERAGGGGVRIPGSPGGVVSLNYPGKMSSFVAYPFLEVLRSYDALRPDRQGSVRVQNFKGKIFLVGMIAEGRGSQFFRTPVDARLPALCVHATFLDDALHSGFLRSVGGWISSLLMIIVAFACVLSVVFFRPPADKIVTLGILLLVGIVSFLAFSFLRVLLPLGSLGLVGLIGGVSGLVYRHRVERAELRSLHAEKENIMAQLHDREAKLALVERELVDYQSAKSPDRTGELLGEIRRYKTEIRTLSSRADDMEEFQGDDEEESPEAGEFEGIVYAAAGKMKQVIDFVAKIARSDAPVLILGESGTGKELVARAIHRRSGRESGPFIAVNCGALSEGLLESELFGHEKGAFTGAVREKPGRFELADGGTIFLDEIGEVTEGFQLKLLRVLQEGEFERVGGTKTITANVRVLAATNKDLKEVVRTREFREDLYYRLNVLSVALPPLRERQADIPLLIRHFLDREHPGMRVSRNVMEALRQYRWGGNIRELESAMKRAVLLARAEKRTMVTVKDLSEDIASVVRDAYPVEDQILELLRDKGFSRSSISESADELGGLNRGTVAEYLRGECLKAFAEHLFDEEKAVRHVSLSADPAVNDRVRKKLKEYLVNIAEAIDPSQPWEASRVSLKPKLKNLPQRYHLYLEQVAEACFRGVWKVDSGKKD